MTVKQFAKAHKITMTAQLIGDRPDKGDDDFARGSTNWRCVFRRQGKQMTVYFTQAPAICEEPKVDDVLGCMASDSCGFENARDFEGFASEYGYDPDSRKAERIYNACRDQADRLRRFLPNRIVFHELLYEVEPN